MGRVRPFLLALALAAFACASGQTTHVKGLIWKASSDKDSIYLVGSMHVGSKRMFPLPPIYETAFKEASTLVVEVNITAVSLTSVWTTLREKATYKGGDSLFKHIPAKTAEKLRALCKTNGMPEAMIGMFKPWLAALMVYQLSTASAASAGNQSLSPELGIDVFFLRKAKAAKKPVVEAESLDAQMTLLSMIPDAEGIQALDAVVSLPRPSAPKAVDHLEDDWIKGDADTMWTSLKSEMGSGFSERIFLEARNPHMADVAEGFLKKHKTCFFVVGAGHMLGPTGIVELLKKRGYKVEQVL